MVLWSPAWPPSPSSRRLTSTSWPASSSRRLEPAWQWPPPATGTSLWMGAAPSDGRTRPCVVLSMSSDFLCEIIRNQELGILFLPNVEMLLEFNSIFFMKKSDRRQTVIIFRNDLHFGTPTKRLPKHFNHFSIKKRKVMLYYSPEDLHSWNF